MVPPSGAAASDPKLTALAATILASALDRSPVEATYLGNHERDGLLGDPSAEAAAARAAQVRAQLAELAGVEPHTPDDAVDAAVLRTVLAAELLELDELREAEWNPMVHNPGAGLHALLSREFAPLPERLTSVVSRLRAVPDYLAAARTRLGTMSPVHLETARTQLDGTIGLIDAEVAVAAAAAPAGGGVAAVAEQARAALVEHQRWLESQAATATRDPRIGAELFREKLALALDTAFDPQALLARAEADLERVSAEIAQAAGRLAGERDPDAATVRAVLDRLAKDVPDDATILGHCVDALAETTAFVRDRELISVFDDPIVVLEMPEIDRGVAVAYCREAGPLETAPLPTEIAVSPTPTGWSAEQIASFYREYNLHMLHNLTVHEAMPGHALQLMHAKCYPAATPVRSVWSSGSFVEGWAVYAEELLATHGYRSDVSGEAAAAVRMQQLKMQLRMIINTILDIRFHCADLDEAGALELMQRRGFQEQGEAAGKWRRVQLTSTQLCTYYVGYTEVRAVAADLRSARPDWTDRQRHDAMLGYGSPPARHLRTLLGLPPADG